MSLLTDRIRQACAEVARVAQSVRIDEARIEAYALSLPLERVNAPTVDPQAHYLADEAGTAAFFLTIDTINFGSGYFPHLRKKPGMSGYFTIATSLKEHFDQHGPLSPQALATISHEQCRRIFGQDAANGPAMALMGWFASALNDLGRLVLSRYGGKFSALIQSADRSALRLMERLAEMPFYRDVHRYREGLEVPFYKRAQIAAADLAIAFCGRGLGEFGDLDQLTMFADNLVPHVLRIDGILSYDPDLARRIDTEELLVAGSAEEIEIRACAVHTVELMRQALARQGRPTTSSRLDYYLWHRGQEKHYKAIKPRHRARCVYY